jgi:oligopeptide/dipeptide ABC transporter ATP-binding protein
MTALVAAEGLSRQFGGGLFGRSRPVHAVSDVSLAVGRGEAVGLVGESGSGKSTVGRLMLGLLKPTAGRVLLDGTDLSGGVQPEQRRRMQLVFQDPFASLDARRRIGVQVADGMAIHRLADKAGQRARVEALLTEVGLTAAHADRFPHEFSGGQRQRIAIARALAPNPEFLVADEAVSALDVSVQAQILALFADLRSRLGIGLLFISHDLKVVRALCDRVAVMYLGRIMEEGPADRVLERPLHPYTRALLSASPSLDPARRQVRILLGGDPPSPSAPPSGCVFRTRCPLAIDACATTVPPLVAAEPGHSVACIRLDEAQSLGAA